MEENKEYSCKNLFIFSKRGNEKLSTKTINDFLSTDDFYCFIGMYNRDCSKVKDVLSGEVYPIKGKDVIVSENVTFRNSMKYKLYKGKYSNWIEFKSDDRNVLSEVRVYEYSTHEKLEKIAKVNEHLTTKEIKTLSWNLNKLVMNKMNQIINEKINQKLTSNNKKDKENDF